MYQVKGQMVNYSSSDKTVFMHTGMARREQTLDHVTRDLANQLS